MNWCVWVEIPERPGYFDCLHCKLPLGHPRGQRRPREYPGNVRRECAGPAQNHGTLGMEIPAPLAPSLVTRAKSYLTARKKWIEAGMPLRTEEERAAILPICQACEHYDPRPVAPGFDGGRCKACGGCGLANERNVLNKIAWSTEACPRGHWPESKRHPDPDDGRAG